MFSKLNQLSLILDAFYRHAILYRSPNCHFQNRKKDEMKSAFFKISLTLGVVDVLAIVHLYIFVKFPAFAYFREFYVRVTGVRNTFHPEYHPKAGVFSMYGQMAIEILGVCQYSIVTLMTFNRFTAVCVLRRHQQVGGFFNFVVQCRSSALGVEVFFQPFGL